MTTALLRRRQGRRALADRVQLLPDLALDVLEVPKLASVTEGDRHPVASRASRTTNAVYVILRVFRESIINYVTNPFNMNPSTCYIGSHQYFQFSVFKVLQGF